MNTEKQARRAAAKAGWRLKKLRRNGPAGFQSGEFLIERDGVVAVPCTLPAEGVIRYFATTGGA